MPDQATQRLNVSLGARSYDICIGRNLIARAAEFILPVLARKHAIIVTDTQVAPHYLVMLQTSLEAAGIATQHCILPAGESTKSFGMLEKLVDDILSHRPERKTMLIALGGGVIGDITGFAASIVLRGIDFVQIPTTLLAQVDSSVGGKTGINTRWGKNLAGSFYQPRLVLADTDALKTLPKRQMLAGYAEIVKYGIINNEEFFSWLEANGDALLNGDDVALAHAIRTSCDAKARIVAADEKEQDVRALLNLGHTFGHALEAETGFSETLLHGEAVAIGMVMALQLSEQIGICPHGESARLAAHLKKVGLPDSPLAIRTQWNAEALIAHFHHDKKVQDGKLTFILAKHIGASFISQEVTHAQLEALLSSVLSA